MLLVSVVRMRITVAGRQALSKLGPTIHHRRSFAPVAELLGLIVSAEEPPPELPL